MPWLPDQLLYKMETTKRQAAKGWELTDKDHENEPQQAENHWEPVNK